MVKSLFLERCSAMNVLATHATSLRWRFCPLSDCSALLLVGGSVPGILLVGKLPHAPVRPRCLPDGKTGTGTAEIEGPFTAAHRTYGPPRQRAIPGLEQNSTVTRKKTNWQSFPSRTCSVKSRTWNRCKTGAGTWIGHSAAAASGGAPHANRGRTKSRAWLWRNRHLEARSRRQPVRGQRSHQAGCCGGPTTIRGTAR